MLEDSGCSVLLTQESAKEYIPPIRSVEIISLDSEPEVSLLKTGQTTNLQSDVCSTNLLYVIYTSGSTGKPKGALIEHRNVISLLFSEGLQFDFNENDVWTLFHSICFDFSVWEVLVLY